MAHDDVDTLHSMFPSFTLVHLSEILRHHKGHMKRAIRAIKAEEKRNRRAELSVAIVGGGIGGLALALGLQRLGVRCQVFERDRSFDERRQGYGLTMQQGASSLRALGFDIDVGDNLGVHSSRHVVFTSDGTLVGNWGQRVWGPSEGKKKPSKSNFHLPRQALRKLLLDALRPGTVVWGHRFVRFGEPDCEKPRIRAMTLSPNCRFEESPCDTVPDLATEETLERSVSECDGASPEPDAETSKPAPAKMLVEFEAGDGTHVVHTANVVVGCDGINGSVRRQLIGEESSPLQYLGCLVVLGIVGNLPGGSVGADVADGKTAFQMSDGTTRIFGMPFDASHAMWQLSFPMPLPEATALSQAGPAALKAEAVRRCGAWAAPVPQLLGATEDRLVSGYPVYDRALLEPEAFAAGGGEPESGVPGVCRPSTEAHCRDSEGLPVTLLGDAAHPMSPFKGQGANQALADAVRLARELYNCGGERPAAALRRYEAEMLPRSATKVLASREAATFLHSEVAVSEGNSTRGGMARLER